ncbi:6860_t:CDS:2 [Dentiscutata heterogama]|uniref:6860_t:CDS:1 n=1 Tax=Dentiscutata heterogama TaxID=1316150 RepID=A0ACA9KQB5_9GLOM|nr:6860_t:CDS:2 [Dentiscutata heterogama]
MDFSFVYHTINILSLPLTFILMIVYKDHKNHPTIACYSGTLFLASLVSGLIGFIRLIQGSKFEQNIICSFQGVMMIYILLASEIWPACIAFNVWIQFNLDSVRWSNRRLLFVYMTIGWGIPIVLTLAALINSNMNGGMVPWPNYCMPAPSIFLAAIFFIGAVAIITTLALSVRDVLLTIKYEIGQLSDSLVVVNNSLNKRIAIFGIAITAPFFIVFIASVISFLIENRLNFVWIICADFAMSAMPWITFVFFGTTSEAVRKYLPKCCFSSGNRDNVPVKPSTISRSLRKNINVPSSSSREPSLDDLIAVSEGEKVFSQTPPPNFGVPGGSTVSSFSQRADPNSPNPFSHRKNPSLTIKIDSIKPDSGSKIVNSRVSRIRKGKEKVTSIRNSFLYKTHANNSTDDYSYSNASESMNKDSSKNRKADVSHGKSSAFHEIVSPNRRSPRQTRHTITEGSKVEKREFPDEPKKYLLKQFSFEKRHRSETIIKLPSEFGIKAHSQNSSLSISQTDNHLVTIISPPITSVTALPHSENSVTPETLRLQNEQKQITARGSLSSLKPQIGLSAPPPHKSSKESLKNKTIHHSSNIYLKINNGSSSSTNATFGSPVTPKSMELTSSVNSFRDEISNNNRLSRSPSVGLPSTPSFGTMAVRSTKSRPNTQLSSSSSKSSKTTVSSNNRNSTSTTRSSNGFTLTPRGSRAFNTTRPVTSNDNGLSSLASDDENEEGMRELRQIVEEFDDQASLKTSSL